MFQWSHATSAHHSSCSCMQALTFADAVGKAAPAVLDALSAMGSHPLAVFGHMVCIFCYIHVAMWRSYLQHPIQTLHCTRPLPLPVGSFVPTQVGTLWTGTLPFHTQLRLVDVLLYHGQHGYLVSCLALAKGSAALIAERTSPGEAAAALREAWRPEVCALHPSRSCCCWRHPLMPVVTRTLLRCIRLAASASG